MKQDSITAMKVDYIKQFHGRVYFFHSLNIRFHETDNNESLSLDLGVIKQDFVNATKQLDGTVACINIMFKLLMIFCLDIAVIKQDFTSTKEDFTKKLAGTILITEIVITFASKINGSLTIDLAVTQQGYCKIACNNNTKWTVWTKWSRNDQVW